MRHVSGRVAGGYSESGDTCAWLVSAFYREFSSTAVPLFVMISGALLLQRRDEPLPFYRKRFGKVLTPFLAWSCIYIICYWLIGHTLADGTSITLSSSVGAILSGNVSTHLWFMYIIMALYLVAPFLAVFVHNASKNMLFIFLVLWLFSAVVFPVINDVAKGMLDIENIANVHFRFELVPACVGLFIAGYVLSKYPLSKRQMAITFTLWFFFSVAKPINVYLRTTSSDSTVVSLCNFLGSYVFSIVSHRVVLALPAFMFLRSLGDIPSLAYSRFSRIISAIVPLSFGIYLSHYLLVRPGMLALNLWTCESWLVVLFAVPILTILFYLATGGMVYLIRTIRHLRFLVP